MATINGASTTNNVNHLTWSYSTAIPLHTDRATSVDALHAEIQRAENLGVGVTATDPFTLLT